MIHQELLFAENLTVAENLSLGDLPARGIWVDRKEMRRRALEWLTAIGSDIDPDTQLGQLPIAKQQLVQIAGGIGELIRELRSQGMACIYVSHRLEEVFAVCDRISVLRDGQLVGTRDAAEVDRDELVRMMIGRELAVSLSDHTETVVGEDVLRVTNLSSPGKFSGASFAVRRGEIVGFAGLVGAGRTEVVEAVFGIDPRSQGEVKVHGRVVKGANPRQSMKIGIGLVPEDRKRHGLVLSMNVRENVSLPTIDRLAAAGVVSRRKERSVVSRFMESMRVKAPTMEAATTGLSGGNQQKLVLAKWLAADTDLLIVDEPTRGVDVGAKAEIHNLIRGMARDGKAILLISSELPELLALCTRVLVMRAGRIVGELPGGASEEQVMRLMAGIGS
jgi:ABC-type sugar transport system ATPase subunit